jgi:hypothetical protein
MSVKIDGLGKLEISLQKRTDAVVKAISETMEANVERMKGNAKRQAPKNFGQLQGEIASEKNNDLSFTVYSGPVAQAWLMEFGTKKKFRGNGRDDIAAQYKGKPSGGTWPQMIASIQEWLQKKRYFPPEIRSAKAKYNYAKFIAGRIAKNGIEPANEGTGYFFKQYDRQLPIIKRSLQMAIKKFSQ